MMRVFVRHRVDNYLRWKEVFDADAENRKKHGSLGGNIFRSAIDPNEVFVVLKWEGLQHAQEFLSSPETKRRMEHAGVIDFPDVYFMDETDSSPT